MLTKWVKNYFNMILVGKSYSEKCYAQIKTANGTIKYANGGLYSSYFPNSKNLNFNTNKGAGVSVGSGTTPATDEDYWLENQIRSGISGSVTHNVLLDVSGDIYRQIVITINNTSSSDITVSEVAWADNFSGISSSYGTSGNYSGELILIDRTVLETPATIHAGETKVLEYKIKFTPLTISA